MVLIDEQDPEAVTIADSQGVRTLDTETGRIHEGLRAKGEAWWVKDAMEGRR